MSYFGFVGAVYLILTDGDKKNVLLLRRSGTGNMDGNYSIVAGHMDGGETAVEALIREAKEEVNIDLEDSNLTFSGVVHRVAPSKKDPSKTVEIIDLYFHASTWEGELVNNEPEKHDQIIWSNIDELPENILPFVRSMIENLKLGNVQYLSYNF